MNQRVKAGWGRNEKVRSEKGDEDEENVEGENLLSAGLGWIYYFLYYNGKLCLR